MQSIAHMYQESARKYRDRPAFATRKGKEFQSRSYGQLYDDALALATALAELGLSSGDKVGLFADNRYEWIVSSMAITLCGAADVPRGTDITADDIRHIVPHSDMKILIVENESTLRRVTALQESAVLKTVILMEGRDSNARQFLDLLERGVELLSRGNQTIQDRLTAIASEHLFTLIYTSGTTGQPKGVMLSHGNLLSQIKRLPMEISAEERILSILPVWHIFERIFELIAISRGCATYYSSVRTLKEDLTIVKPTFMASAPRLWESIYAGIRSAVARGPASKRLLFRLATLLASAYYTAKNSSASYKLALPLLYLPYRALDWLVLAKIRQATGGKLKASVSGGGALPLHVDLFFNSIGIPVLEGYGMTETSPVLAVRTPEQLVVGTVGPVYPDTDLRLVDPQTKKVIWPGLDAQGKKGEIHVRGPQVMLGYYKNPEATAAVISEGWLNTGDLGMMMPDGCLRIVGRTKETIVLLGGENVEPVPIENRLLQSPLISQCMVVGQDQKYLGALIVPDAEALSRYGEDLATIARHPGAAQEIRAAIKECINESAGFKSFERIVDFRLLPEVFTVGSELTAKLSIKRHFIAEKYGHLIGEMYTRGD
ncbi:MAG: long-chain fatty acid--CoA ligase [Spirochaetales bacterium]|nr:long-chain fatty acid--CoA ligase [Spirochaetales bacterium]